MLFVYSWILQKFGFCVRSEASSVENCHLAATFNSSAVQIAGTFSRLHPTSLHNGQLIEKLKWRQKPEKSIENTVFAGFCRNQTEGVTDFPLHCFFPSVVKSLVLLYFVIFALALKPINFSIEELGNYMSLLKSRPVKNNCDVGEDELKGWSLSN